VKNSRPVFKRKTPKAIVPAARDVGPRNFNVHLASIPHTEDILFAIFRTRRNLFAFTGCSGSRSCCSCCYAFLGQFSENNRARSYPLFISYKKRLLPINEHDCYEPQIDSDQWNCTDRRKTSAKSCLEKKGGTYGARGVECRHRRE
jgi:hypothetical protein